MNLFNIKNTFATKKAKQWPEIYICVDLHGTIIPSGRSSNDQKDHLKFYEEAKEVLQWISKRDDIFLILWTSTPVARQASVDEWFRENGIKIDFWNENPHAKDTPRSSFAKKFYFNILLDDRAGFDPQTDWKAIKQELIDIGEWVVPAEEHPEEHPSGLSGEHSVVLDAIHQECLHGRE